MKQLSRMNFAQFFLLVLVTCTGASAARAQMCKLPPIGNPQCASDASSQSSPNPPTGVGNPIDVTSGNKYREETDVEFGGDLAIGFRRHYNSLQAEVGVLGRGWSHTYETRLSRFAKTVPASASPAPPSITVTQGDGRVITFESFEASATLRRYRSTPSGYGLIEEDLAAVEHLRRSAAGSSPSSAEPVVWKWRWLDGRVISFNGRGLLHSIEQPDGRAVQLQFDLHRRLLRATDSDNNWLAATYWDDAAERLQAFAATPAMAAHGSGYRGRLKSLSLSNGAQLKYEYDAHGNLSDVVHADGSMRRYAYTPVGGHELLSQIIGRDGNVFATYGYDPEGHAVRSSRPDHRDDVAVSYQWPDPKHLLGRTTVEDASGAKTVYTWRADPQAQTPVIIAADGPGCSSCPPGNVRYEYTAAGHIARTTRVDGTGMPVEETILATDDLGRPRTLEVASFDHGRIQPAQWRETREYQGGSLLPTQVRRPSVVPGHEHTLRIDYNARGQPTRIEEQGFELQQPLGFINASLSDSPAAPISRVTLLTYEEVKGLSLLKHLHGPVADAETSFGYDSRGRLATIWHPTRQSERFERDSWGRVTSRTGLDGVRELLEYGADGNITRFARGDAWMTLRYDAAGRIAAIHDSLGQQLELTRNERGDLVQLADAAGNSIEWKYADNGQIRELSLLDPDGKISQRGSGVDAVAAPRETAIADEGVLSSVVKSLPDEVAAAIPGWQSAGDAAQVGPRAQQGLVQTAYDVRRQATTYTYDDFGRLTAQRSSSSGTTRFRWDAADHLIARIADDGTRTDISRDASGRAIRVRAGSEDGRIEWGTANRPTRITFKAGEERFEYDRQARLTAHILRIDGKEFRLSYEFDALGRVLRKHLPDGATLRYRYNGPLHPKPGVLAGIFKEGLIERPVISGLNAADERFADRGFTFGNGLAQRRVLAVDGTVVSDGNEKVGQSHLDWSSAAASPATYTRKASVGSRVAPDVTPQFGDRLAAQLSELGLGERPPARNQGVTASFADALRFNSRGELVEDSQRRYEWDALGRLERVSKRDVSNIMRTSFSDAGTAPSAVIAEYRYNLLGERIAKIVNSADGPTISYFFWDGAELAAEMDQHGKVLRDYVYLEGRPVALLAGAAIYAIHTDHRLAPIAVTAYDRRVVWQADVRDNGLADVLAGSTLELPLRASNQYFDAETGLHYNLYRYLDAKRGRYLSPDPLGLAAGPDVYQFALGNPHALIDPLGLQTVPANGNISSWSFQTRLQYVLNRAIPQVPGEIGNILRSMVSPTNIAITAGVFTAWAIAQLTPAGWIADAAIAGIGYFFLGETIAELVSLTVDTYRLTSGATCVSDLNKAAKNFANITAQVVVNIGAYGATKLADVMGGLFKVKPSGVWNLAPFERGVAVEKALGHNVPPSYPEIDIFDLPTGSATSIKSLDLNANTYQSASALTSTVKGYINRLAKFNGVDRPSLDTLGKIKSRSLDLAVPGAGTAAQQQALLALQAYARNAGVTLNIVVYP